MGFPVRKCALIGRFVDPRVAESMSTLLPHLKKRDVQVLISDAADIPEVDGAESVDAGRDENDRTTLRLHIYHPAVLDGPFLCSVDKFRFAFTAQERKLHCIDRRQDADVEA